jgi:hypothetical protein
MNCKEGGDAIHGWAIHVKRQLKRLKHFLEKYEVIFKKD